HSCSIGPSIRLAETVEDPYRFEISCRIYRGGRKVFEEAATTGRMKRKMEELVSFLIRDNPIFDGTVLLTGTCIVPPDDFTLREGDRIEFEISGSGHVANCVKAPVPQSCGTGGEIRMEEGYRAVMLNPEDSVAVALSPIPAGAASTAAGSGGIRPAADEKRAGLDGHSGPRY